MDDNEKMKCARLGIILQSTAIGHIIRTSRDEKTAIERICKYISIRHLKIDPSELGEMADEYEQECKEADNVDIIELMDAMIDNIGANDPPSP